MDLLPVILTSVLVILAVVLIVVGVQVFLVLLEVKKTMQRINLTIDIAEQKLIQPLQHLGGMAAGLQTGFKVFESFVSWLQKNKKA